MIEVVAERGYPETRVVDVIGVAGVSRNPVNCLKAASRRASALGPAASTSTIANRASSGCSARCWSSAPKPAETALCPWRARADSKPLAVSPQQVAEQDVIGREEAVLLAGEEFIERLSRDSGDVDHVHYAGIRVASLGDDLDHRLQDSTLLGLRHRLPR